MRQRPPEPIPLTGKKRRLKFLNEFESPYWLGLFKLAGVERPPLWPIVLLGVAIGAALGWLMLLQF